MSWKIKELFEYQDLPKVVGSYRPLYASSYQMAAQLSYMMGEPVPKVFGMARRDYFDSLPEAVPQARRYYVIVNHQWMWETPLALEGHVKVDRKQIHPSFDILTIERQ
jgi:hypothetical protein